MNPVPASVVIPAFGRAELLREALASVASQTRPAAEVIVVDDGSDPPLEPVAAEFGARYLRQSNRGVSAARNAGAAASNEAWLAFLDSDDRWQPDKLERQWAALEGCPEADVAICDFTVVGEGLPWHTTALGVHPAYQAIPRLPLGDARFRLEQPGAAQALARANFVQPSTLVVRKTSFFGAGGFDESLRYCEDYEFALRLFVRAVAVTIDAPLMLYRSHAIGLSAREAEMRRGDLRIGELVRDFPQRYPEGTAGAFAAKLPRKLLELAKGELMRDDHRAAREAARKSLAARRDPFTLGVLAYAYLAPLLPRSFRRRALEVWSRRVSTQHRAA